MALNQTFGEAIRQCENNCSEKWIKVVGKNIKARII